VAVALVCSYFLFQTYEIFMYKDKWSSSLYSAYGNFETWWNKHAKRLVMKEFAYTMPEQRSLHPYRNKITMILGYLYGFGSLWLLSGDKWASLVLLVPHLIHALITNAPNSATSYKNFSSQEQSYLLDILIAFALLMISGSQLSIASTKPKQTGTR
jgi:hypothetical protein